MDKRASRNPVESPKNRQRPDNEKTTQCPNASTPKRAMTVFALLITILGVAAAQTPPAPPTPPVAQAAPPATPAFPPAVSTALDQVALTGADRTDVNLRFVRTLFMPSVAGKVQSVLIFEMTPVEMKVEPAVPPVPPAPPAPATPVGGAAQPAPAVPPAPPAPITVNTFYRLTKADANGAYLPYDDYIVVYQEPAEQAAGAASYTVSLTLDPGSYKLLMAVSDEKLAKMATVRASVDVPNLMSEKGELVTTPVMFTNSVKMLDAAAVERSARVHKNEFYFANLAIQPKFDNAFAAGESKELLYFVLGAKPEQTERGPGVNVEISYAVKKGSESVIKYDKKTMVLPAGFPMINHPLPLEAKDKTLTPGAYSLSIEIEDKVGGKKLKTEVPIEIK